MEKFISAESKNALVKLGLYQIVGGCLGLIVLTWQILKSPVTLGGSLIILLIGMLFFGYSIFSGWQCTKMTARALTYSFINQGIQILGIEAGGYAFQYVSGLSFGASLHLTGSVKFDFELGLSAIILYFGAQPGVIIIDINVMAIIVFVLIDRLNNKVKAEKEIRSDTRFL
ncbi:MAG TPA: hypothetical protein VKR53_00725 [Puia sp.]|nr:hypothetical protein [Puia sp.]